MTVTITGVGPDYTSLGSFGTAEQFGDNLVASMDRSYQLRAPAFGARPAGSVQVGLGVSVLSSHMKAVKSCVKGPICCRKAVVPA